MNDHPLAPALARGLEAMGIPLSQAAQGRLLDYLDLLRRWNRAYNLTAVDDPEEMVTRHLLDSLSVLPYLDRAPEGAVADVGSGAGLPGIPLAVARPQRRFLLVDSIGKKVRFQREAVRRLALDNVEPLQARVEALAEHHGRYAVVTARAFAPLGELARLAGPLLREDGCLLAMKGRLDEDELAALAPPWRIDACHRLRVPGERGARHLLVLRRTDTATRSKA